jgi:hypothetical protein
MKIKNFISGLGDLNCDMLKSVSDQPTKTVKAIYEAYRLSQLITKGTRITNRSCTLIDHYVTSMPEKVNLSGVIQPELVITVNLIYGIRKINPIISSRKKAKKIEVRNMQRFN